MSDMGAGDRQLVPIGQFSKMSRLSIKALRLYGENELLPPVYVDPSTGPFAPGVEKSTHSA
jgi:hypothetical protein